MGGLENVVDAAQGSIIFFDVPVHAYAGLTLLKFLRFDAMLGMVFSASTKDLLDFTAKPLDNAAKGVPLLSDKFNAPKFDLVLRASLTMFYLELNGRHQLGGTPKSIDLPPGARRQYRYPVESFEALFV